MTKQETAPDHRDFFISFTHDDLDIATAIRDALFTAGYDSWFHPVDKPKGAGIAGWMETGLNAFDQMILICSETYFSNIKKLSAAERQSAFMTDPTNEDAKIICVKTDHFNIPLPYNQNEYIGVIGMQAPEAGAEVVNFFASEKARQNKLASETLSREKTLPKIYHVPGQRNPHFTGRDDALLDLHEAIKGNQNIAITALSGMGGIGKSTLAREYALRHGTASRFSGVWWFDAETDAGILSGYDALAKRAELELFQDARETAEATRSWLGRQKDAKPFLVIFDNALNNQAIKNYLPQGSVQTIITSRYGNFPSARSMPLGVWDEATTIDYLQSVIGRGTDEELTNLAKELGGLPLAAELAAIYLKTNSSLSIGDYIHGLLELMDEPPESLDVNYPRSLFATFELVLSDLEQQSPDAASLLNICSFLAPEGVGLKTLIDGAERSTFMPKSLAKALHKDEAIKRAKLLRELTQYSIVKIDGTEPENQTLILHRLLAEVAKARMPDQDEWASIAIEMVDGLFPTNINDGPSSWPLCGQLLPHALALQNLPIGRAGKRLDHLLNQAGLYFYARGDNEGAIKFYRRSLEIMEETQKNAPAIIATVCNNLANLLKDFPEHWDEAEQLFERSLSIHQQNKKIEHQNYANTYSNFGVLRWEQKRFADAVDFTEQAAEINKNTHGEISARHATALNNLGAIYGVWFEESENPKHKQKERDLKSRSAQITRQMVGWRDPLTTPDFNNLAVMQANDGDFSKAAENMLHALAINLSLSQFEHPDTHNLLWHLLILWHKSNQEEKAQKLLSGDLTELVNAAEYIEKQHRLWMAEETEHGPKEKHFGPPSPDFSDPQIQETVQQLVMKAALSLAEYLKS